VKVHFTDAALQQLDGIYGYIAKDSTKYAKRVVDQIIEKAQRISVMPRAAAIVPEYANPDVREIFHHSYRIVYRLVSDRIDVVAIVHGSKPLPLSVEELIS
jgi:toxin ParE1/3/4